MLGPPGGGKGTQAQRLADKFFLSHISTGELLRRAVAEGDELGKKVEEILNRGNLVPDDLMMEIIKENLTKDKMKDGFILDGFPRTIPQAKALEEEGIAIEKVLFLDVPRDVLKRRLLSRRECPECGNIMNAKQDEENTVICSKCGALLEKREDDTERTIDNRLEVFFRRTHPLIDYYRQKDLLVDIDGDQIPEMVFRDICKAVKC